MAAYESELEQEFEQELHELHEGEGEGEAGLEGEGILGTIGNVLGGLLGEGEGEGEFELAGEFEGEGEDEFEGEFESGEQFFGKIFKKVGGFVRRAAPILRRVAKIAAPMVASAIGGPFGGIIGKAATSFLEGEGELEAQELHELHELGELHEYERESEAETEFEGESEQEIVQEIAHSRKASIKLYAVTWWTRRGGTGCPTQRDWGSICPNGRFRPHVRLTSCTTCGSLASRTKRNGLDSASHSFRQPRIFRVVRDPLFAYDQHFKLSGFGCGQEELVGLGIERHGLGSRYGFHVLYHGVLVRSFLMGHRDGALSIRVENQAGVGVEGGRIDVITDGKSSDDLPCICIHHRHHVAAATDEQSAVRPVHGHARRRFAGRGWPALLDGHFARVNLEYEVFVFQVVENVSGAVCDSELRQETGCDYL